MTESLTHPRIGTSIVVVSGLPRSGTSMAMQMLEAAGLQPIIDTIRRPDDDNPRGYYEDERVKRLHLEENKSWLNEAKGKIIKVVSFFLQNLPDSYHYKVIFMERSLEEVLASQNKMLERKGSTSGASDEEMLDIYTKHVAETKRFLAAQPNFETLYFNYRDVARSPRQEAERIHDFLGLPSDPDHMANAVDRDLYRNRRITRGRD